LQLLAFDERSTIDFLLYIVKPAPTMHTSFQKKQASGPAITAVKKAKETTTVHKHIVGYTRSQRI
jgi:hypothetical protein